MIDQPHVAAITGWLGIINLSLAIFNIIPAFPMDGGRILRAILWRVRGDQFAATRGAAVVGRLFGYLLIALGVWWAFTGDFSGLWLALIGWFLSNAAGATVQQLGVQRSLAGVKVRDVMDAEPASVSPNETIADLVDSRLVRGDGRSFLVRHDDGGLAGIVSLSDVRRVAREDWPDARVTDIMTRYADLARVGPDDELGSALELLQERQVNQLPVVEDDGRTVVGLLTRDRHPAPGRHAAEARRLSQCARSRRPWPASWPTARLTEAETPATGPHASAACRPRSSSPRPSTSRRSTTRRWTAMRCARRTRRAGCELVGEVAAGRRNAARRRAGHGRPDHDRRARCRPAPMRLRRLRSWPRREVDVEVPSHRAGRLRPSQRATTRVPATP